MLGLVVRNGPPQTANRVGDRAPDQVQASQEIQAVRDFRPFLRGQNAIEDAAGINDGDQHRVTRVWDVVGEEDSHDARIDFPARLAVDHGISAGSPHESRQGQEAARILLEDASLDQARDRVFLDFPRDLRRGETFDPVARVVNVRVRGDHGERRIEEVVVQPRRIRQHQALGVGIDAVFQRQVHQDGPRECVVPGPVRNGCELPALLVKQEDEEVLGESQHGRPILG